MTIETPLPVAEEARPQRPAGFPPGSTVDVRQVHDQDWETLRALTYHVTREDFEVPVRERTGFASVPRMFVWFITRYGRYAKTVRLRDYLCSVAVPADRIGRIDADGIFLQAMRELSVSLLRRWIMWAPVRLGALTNTAGRKKLWTEAWYAALVAAVALPIIAPATAVILITLPVYYLVELLAWIPLKATHRIQENRKSILYHNLVIYLPELGLRRIIFEGGGDAALRAESCVPGGRLRHAQVDAVAASSSSCASRMPRKSRLRQQQRTSRGWICSRWRVGGNG